MNATDLALMRLMDVLSHPGETLVLLWDGKGAGPGPLRWGASVHCRTRRGWEIVGGEGRSIAQALDDVRRTVERGR